MSEKLSPLKSPSGLAVTGSGVEVPTFIASSKVPVAVPSDRNSPLLLSLELSKAKNSTAPATATKLKGVELAEPGTMSLTMTVPVAVPSDFHSSKPFAPTES
jgi:hypothetical protein